MWKDYASNGNGICIKFSVWDYDYLYCPYDLGEVNGGTIEMNIKERLGYKGIAKPYVDFDLNISKIIFGNKCNSQLIEELKSYLNDNGISYTYL